MCTVYNADFVGIQSRGDLRQPYFLDEVWRATVSNSDCCICYVSHIRAPLSETLFSGINKLSLWAMPDNVRTLKFHLFRNSQAWIDMITTNWYDTGLEASGSPVLPATLFDLDCLLAVLDILCTQVLGCHKFPVLPPTVCQQQWWARDYPWSLQMFQQSCHPQSRTLLASTKVRTGKTTPVARKPVCSLRQQDIGCEVIYRGLMYRW